MKQKKNKNIIYALKIFVPIIIVIGLFLGGISAGIITFEPPEKKVTTGGVTATIEIDFGDGIIYSNVLTIENSTVFDFLLEFENMGDIGISNHIKP